MNELSTIGAALDRTPLVDILEELEIEDDKVLMVLIDYGIIDVKDLENFEHRI